MTTFCIDCDNVVEATRKMEPWRWLCVKHPNVSNGFGFVTSHTWDNEPPYLHCKNTNGGACPLFETRREADA